MITLPELQVEPGGEYDFPADEATTITAFTAGDWSGDFGNLTVFNSDDPPNPATVIVPEGVIVSYASFSNINNLGSLIVADHTCVNGGGNSGIFFRKEPQPENWRSNRGLIGITIQDYL